MAREVGNANVVIAIIDGQPAHHPDFSPLIRSSTLTSGSEDAHHATFVAGVLFARRGTRAPAICPGCTPMVHPIFGREPQPGAAMPRASPDDLAAAIGESVRRGADVINLSVAVAQPSTRSEPQLRAALDFAARAGCMVVAAAGNQSLLGSSPITRHSWVIPVAAFDATGRPLHETNLGASVGRQGLGGPGVGVRSLGPRGGYVLGGGTSAAVPFVTGAIGLLLSAFPTVSRYELRQALTAKTANGRASVVPRLLDAESTYAYVARAVAA
ncbi:MAG: S8 family serine peptidase [Jatrophihabitantaceae bacterium]